MSLFTDGNISGIENLQAYDAGVLEVTSGEGIPVDDKLALATTEIGIVLDEFLTSRAGWDGAGRGVLSLGNVVVTPPLKNWHTLLTLSLIYGDLKGNHLHSRYGEKWKSYERLGRRAADLLFRRGVGLTLRPIPRAAQPAVRTVPGTLPQTTYYVRIAFENREGDVGAPSEVLVFTLTSDGVPGVKAVSPSPGATGFHVYAGTDEETITRQNGVAIGLEVEWVMPMTGLVPGLGVPTGQAPSFYLRNDRILNRG